MSKTKENYYKNNDDYIEIDDFIGEEFLCKIFAGVNGHGDIMTYNCLNTENKILFLKELQKQLTIAITEKIINLLEK